MGIRINKSLSCDTFQLDVFTWHSLFSKVRSQGTTNQVTLFPECGQKKKTPKFFQKQKSVAFTNQGTEMVSEPSAKSKTCSQLFQPPRKADNRATCPRDSRLVNKWTLFHLTNNANTCMILRCSSRKYFKVWNLSEHWLVSGRQSGA